MSSAFYPLGMKSYNNHVPQGGYKTWKGTGILSNPVGIAQGHIRPLTNNDMGNVFQTGFGLPRPIKHYRKGRVIPSAPIEPNNLIEISPNEIALINYNMNRIVKSSTGSSLGGGAGGRGLLNELMDNPGSFIVKQNQPGEVNEALKLNNDCKTCEGTGLVASYYPNNTYITNNPDRTTTTKPLCCNEEKKARRRVLPASTILKKNYYTTHAQYMENRCQTFEQRSFNFVSGAGNAPYKPGSALAISNEYIANCYPNGEIYETSEASLVNAIVTILNNTSILTPAQITEFYDLKITTFNGLVSFLSGLPEPYKTESLKVYADFVSNPYYGVPIQGPSNPRGCKVVVYKPNNPQFAKQGSVSSSTRNLKLNVDTIETNAASFNRNNANLSFAQVNGSSKTEIPFILKNKSSPCNSPPIIRFQNKKACYLGEQYRTPISQPSPYRFYPGTVFSSNHFAQSPRNVLM
jgi:hypothetical protein